NFRKAPRENGAPFVFSTGSWGSVVARDRVPQQPPVAAGFVRADAEQRDRLVPGASAEGIDRLGPDLLPVALHVFAPGQPAVFHREEQLARRGQVAVPFIDPLAAD